jgi:excisionase family DNA binding protein
MKDLMSKKEVANYFGVSTKTIENWVEKKGLIETRVVGIIRYKREDVVKFIEEGNA